MELENPPEVFTVLKSPSGMKMRLLSYVLFVLANSYTGVGARTSAKRVFE